MANRLALGKRLRWLWVGRQGRLETRAHHRLLRCKKHDGTLVWRARTPQRLGWCRFVLPKHVQPITHRRQLSALFAYEHHRINAFWCQSMLQRYGLRIVGRITDR